MIFNELIPDNQLSHIVGFLILSSFVSGCKGQAKEIDAGRATLTAANQELELFLKRWNLPSRSQFERIDIDVVGQPNDVRAVRFKLLRNGASNMQYRKEDSEFNLVTLQYFGKNWGLAKNVKANTALKSWKQLLSRWVGWDAYEVFGDATFPGGNSGEYGVGVGIVNRSSRLLGVAYFDKRNGQLRHMRFNHTTGELPPLEGH